MYTMSCFEKWWQNIQYMNRQIMYVANIITREVFKSNDSVWVDSESFSISSYVLIDMTS